jgi:hypothetical protein
MTASSLSSSARGWPEAKGWEGETSQVEREASPRSRLGMRRRWRVGVGEVEVEVGGVRGVVMASTGRGEGVEEADEGGDDDEEDEEAEEVEEEGGVSAVEIG